MSLDPVAFFVSTVAQDLRRMPLAEARVFLQGLLIIGGTHPALESLRETYRHIDATDAQLELIASGQMKLNLGKDGQ